jgi:hypothetical protein
MGAKVAKTTTVARADKNQPAPHESYIYVRWSVCVLVGQSDGGGYLAIFRQLSAWKWQEVSDVQTICYKNCENVVVTYTSPSVGFSLKWYNDNVGL